MGEIKNSRYWRIFFHDGNSVVAKLVYDISIDFEEVTFTNILNNEVQKISKQRYVRREPVDKYEVQAFLHDHKIFKRIDEL